LRFDRPVLRRAGRLHVPGARGASEDESELATSGDLARRIEEGNVNAAVMQRLTDEIAPRVTGARVRDVVSPARDLYVLRLDGADAGALGVSVGRALPLLFAAPDRGPDDIEPTPDVPRPLADLRGATVTGLEHVPGAPTTVVTFRCVSQVGTVSDRVALIELGRRPSVTVMDAGDDSRPLGPDPDRGGTRPRRSDTDRDDSAPTPPERASDERDPGPRSLGWRRDDAGRLHVGLPPGDRPWDETASFDTWNDAALHAAAELLPEIVIGRRRSDLKETIGRRLARKRRALTKVEREIDDSRRAEEFRHKAQLLLMRKDDIPKGRGRVKLLDYDNATVVEVEIEPLLSPQRNAETYFNRARKAERRAERAPLRRDELLQVIGALDSTLSEVDEAPPSRLSELEVEFRQPARRRGRASDDERARFRTYVVSGGWKVLVGKSNRDNDILTHKIARPSDLWFHVRQSPGSHVVLRRAGRKDEPAHEAIMEAAAIAAFHSKARGSASVPVSYTERRYVRKPRGARPGLAVVTNEKVIYVDPGLPET